jgi:tryptophanyl-tRNA synthetase
MASDILLYDAEEVPVGDDQRQHVELTRDLALRFNHRFGETFVVPKATFPAVGARVMDLQQPTAKMSKSSESPQGTVLVLDPPESIVKKVRAAVTDSGSDVRYDPDGKPGISNLLDLYAAATGTGRDETAAKFAGSGYGALKSDVADAVVEYLRPVRERYEALARDPGEVDRLLVAGAEVAEEIANRVLERARTAAGLLPRLHPRT